ncbi:MAG: trypsin-like peptidase domain-containing protein, partial [Actinomycetota bacterium]
MDERENEHERPLNGTVETEDPVTAEVPPVETEYTTPLPVFEPTPADEPEPAEEPTLVQDPPQRRGALRAALIGGVVGAVVAAMVAAGTVALLDDDDAEPLRTNDALAAAAENERPARDDMDIRAVLEKVEPSVVSISTDIVERTPFGGRSRGESAGSGIIISEDGLVLTNAHVVDNADGFEVRTFDGDTFDATIIGIAPGDDIALLEMQDASGLTPAELGNSSSLQVGDEVVAIGNALALGGDPTVTRGIVSAKDRDLSTQGGSLDNLIQTDAAI